MHVVAVRPAPVALDLAVSYAKERLVFGRPRACSRCRSIGSLLDGAMALEAARGLLWRAAEIDFGGGDSSSLAAMAKLAVSDAAVTIVLQGMQLLGGLGYTEGRRNATVLS